MASDITITSLTAVGNLGSISVTVLAQSPAMMSCLSYMLPTSVDIYSATTNNWGAAALVGTVNSAVGVFIHPVTGDGVTRYYWAIPRDNDGNAGARYPATTTGVSATTKTATPGPGSITEDMIQDGAVSKHKFITGITPVEIVATLPATGNYEGRMVFLTSNDKLYRHTGSPAGAAGFTAAVPAVDITGQIVSTQITDGAISTPKLAANSVTATNIVAGAVVAGKLAADSVATNNIVAGAVSAAKMSVAQLSAISANLGTITAGNVTGITFTGGLYRTAASGRRIEIENTNQIRAFNSAGVAVVNIDATNTGGAISVISTDRAGTFSSAGTATNSTVAIANAAPNAPGLDVIISSGTGANSHCMRAFNNGAGGGDAAIGVSSSGGGYAFLSVSGGYGPFTGAHDAFIAKDAVLDIGDIVCDDMVISRNGISDTVTEVYRSNKPRACNVAGVVAARVPFEVDATVVAISDDGHELRQILAETRDRLTINGVGEGQVNVCGLNGNISAGDYITTSALPGKGQRQDDDIKRSCTVARARESVVFDYPEQVKRAACFYECG